LRQITPKEQLLARFEQVVIEVWKERGAFFEGEAEKYEKRLAELEARRRQIFKMREEGSYNKDEFLERKAEVVNEIAAARISMNESRVNEFDIEGALVYAKTFIRALDRQWFDIPLSLRPRFQKLIFPDGIPYQRGNGFGTARLGLLFELNRPSDSSKSGLVPLVRSSWNLIVKELKELQEIAIAATSPADPSILSLLEDHSQVKWGKVA
jgi:hypothetical protein